MVTGKGYFKLFRGLCLHIEISLLSQQAQLGVIGVLKEESSAEHEQEWRVGTTHERQKVEIADEVTQIKP